MQPILESLPLDWEILIWDNGAKSCRREHMTNWAPFGVVAGEGDGAPAEVVVSPRGWSYTAYTVPDLSVYGRYAAIEYASGDLIYVQDDDVILSDPQAIVDAWHVATFGDLEGQLPVALRGDETFVPYLAANMPPEFRPHYPDSALVGFGAAFHRELTQKAFGRFFGELPNISLGTSAAMHEPGHAYQDWFNRECDRVFTCLTPRVLVDVPKVNREFAEAPDRLYRQPGHNWSTQEMLRLARLVRDAN